MERVDQGKITDFLTVLCQECTLTSTQVWVAGETIDITLPTVRVDLHAWENLPSTDRCGLIG